jgi:hypothetical protein
MIKMIKSLFSSSEIEAPFKEKQPPKESVKLLPKDVVFISGKPFQYTEHKDGGEWTLLDNVTDRTPDIKQADKDIIKYLNVREIISLNINYLIDHILRRWIVPTTQMILALKKNYGYPFS